MSSPSDAVGPKKAEGKWVEPQEKSARSLPELKQRASYTAPKRPSSHTILDASSATHHQKGTNGGMPNKANWSNHHHNSRHKLTRMNAFKNPPRHPIWPDPRKYQATSLYVFTLKNPLRRLVIASIESKWWDRTVLTW